MKDRTILFSGEMVRAILDGRKTQTRRVIRPQPDDDMRRGPEGRWWYWKDGRQHTPVYAKCPYGVPGDRLWVKETFAIVHGASDPETKIVDEWLEPETIPRDSDSGFWGVFYRADNCPHPETVEERGFRWRPPIFMPRWASRITLEVTDVDAQKLDEITYADAEEEGTHLGKFIELWDSLNAKRGFPWASDPWVWVVHFRRVQP